MKIPKKVRIMGRDFAVKREPVVLMGSALCFGTVEHGTGTIRLNDSEQDEQHMCVTLWHEILHAVVQNAGLEMKNEEEVVRAISTGVYQIIADNKGMFRE